MGEKLPTHQQGAKILHGEIQEGFGTKKVDDIKGQKQAYEQPEQSEPISYAQRFQLKAQKLEAQEKEEQLVKKPGKTREMS